MSALLKETLWKCNFTVAILKRMSNEYGIFKLKYLVIFLGKYTFITHH